MGAPLSVLRGQRRPGRKWTPLDRLLTLALQAYEDDLCPGCGTPRTYGMDDDAAGLLDVGHHDCHGCAELERHERQERDRGKPPPPGRKSYVTPNLHLQAAMRYPLHVNPPPPMRITTPLD